MRGSLWRRWDLHIHTPASFYHNFKIPNEEKEHYGDNIWDKYIDELEKISEVSVLGITDYFSIEGYKKVLDYKTAGKLKNIDLILPNIEFRLDQVGTDGKKINYHVIFSNELDPDFIEKEFLEQLQIKSYENMTPCRLCRSNIELIGKSLKEDSSEFRGSDYEVGCNHIQINLNQIEEILNKKFKGKFILVLAEKGWDTFDFLNQASQIKRSLLFDSHAVFSSSPNTIKWMLGETYENEKEFKRLFKSLKPCIHGSDAHSFDKLCKPDENRYCWIKADPTFEGLKTIIYEPRGRVKIQPENPNVRKNVYTLDFVKIDNSNINENLSIQEGSLKLNENLVAITGGKGTGKTALLDLISNCFEDRCKRSKKTRDKNSFVQRIQKDKEDLTVEIGFRGHNVENFSKKIIEESFFPKSKITYLPQGKIEDYSSDKKLLAEKIEEIIFKNEKIVEKGCKQQFDDIKAEIKMLADEINDINIGIYSLESETAAKIMLKFDSTLKIKEGELENKTDELLEFKKSIKTDSSSKIEELKEKEEQLQSKSYKLSKVRNDLEELKNNINNFLDDFDENSSRINLELANVGIDCGVPPLDCDRHFYYLEESFNFVDQEMDYVESELKRIGEEQDLLTGNEITEARIIEELHIIKGSIEDLNSNLDSLKQKRVELKTFEDLRIQKYHDLLNKYLQWNNYYEGVINIFSDGKDEILNDISFESSIYFDEDKFINEGSEIFDFRKIKNNNLEELAAMLTAIINLNNEEMRHDELLKFIGDLKLINISLKEKYDNYEFYKWAYGNYFSLRTEAFFKKRPMNKLSMGQKGTVLLKLFLAEGDYPLIIDQPEDNLDNKFIYRELVGAFKDAKKDRQIIIATNNANLVVNSDAEQVIVAEFEENNIFYESGSLENPDTRSKIMHILEGGEKAFREREEKYGI